MGGLCALSLALLFTTPHGGATVEGVAKQTVWRLLAF